MIKNNKKAYDLASLVIWLGVLLFTALIIGSIFWGWGNWAKKATGDKTNLADNDDSDFISNMDDKCCAVNCDPGGKEVDLTCPGPRCGCTEDQLPTKCTKNTSIPCNMKPNPGTTTSP